MEVSSSCRLPNLAKEAGALPPPPSQFRAPLDDRARRASQAQMYAMEEP